MSDELSVLEDNVRTSFKRVEWSHKIQEKQAEIYVSKYKTLETIRIITTSLTSCGVVSLIFVTDLWIKLISALISLTSVVISAVFESFSIKELGVKHKQAAISLLVVRDKYQHLLMEIQSGKKSYTELNDEYNELEKEKHQIYADSPQTTDKAVKKAREEFIMREDNSCSNEEVNRSIPDALSRGEE